MPIEEIVEHCNEESQNLYAESLLKRSDPRVHRPTGVVEGCERDRPTNRPIEDR